MMKHWKSILAILLVFFLGVCCGGAGVALIISNRIQQFVHASPDKRSSLIARALASRLSLTPDQERKVTGIVKETSSKIRSQINSVRPAIVKELVDAQGKINEVLTPAQQQKFKALNEKNRHRMEQAFP